MQYLMDSTGRAVLPRRLGCPYPEEGKVAPEGTITIANPKEQPNQDSCPYCGGRPQCSSQERLLQADYS